MRRRELIVLLIGAMTAPRTLRAQQKAMPVIGYLGFASPGLAPTAAVFLRGLSETGYVEEQNVAIEYRWAEGRYDRLPALAADLARPGGNLTGVSLLTLELMAKRLELLSELVPQASVVAQLVNPNTSTTERMIRDVQEAARVKGVQVHIVKAGSESEIDATLASLAQLQARGLLVSRDPLFNSRREQLVALAARHAVPAIYPWGEFAAAGGLISYGPSLTAALRQVGIYAGKILKGAKPADLPVEQATKLELVVNLKTAKALGLTIPQSILARADEVIE
jgi:putative ABC transport system substrate-binding protein